MTKGKQRQTKVFSIETQHRTDIRQKRKATTYKHFPNEAQHRAENTAKQTQQTTNKKVYITIYEQEQAKQDAYIKPSTTTDK